MFRKNPSIGQELLDVPMGDMIQKMAFSIAEAQMALDSNSIEVAEMMGGLKAVTDTIKDSNGNEQEFINFKDSRVFFGKEKVLLSDAVELYNSNSDQAYKAAIEAKFNGDAEDGYDRDVVDVNGDPSTASTKFTPDNQKYSEVYYRDKTNTPIKWYEYDGDNYIELDGNNGKTIPTTVPGKKMVTPGKGTREVMLPQRLSMLELGFSPTFYQFVDTMIRVSISIKFTREGSSSYTVDQNTESTNNNGGASLGFFRARYNNNKTVTTTQVNAAFSQKFSYSAEGSSILQTKLVPIPPPAILEERIQQQMEIAREESES